MEGKLFIAEAVHLLEDQKPQDLVAGKTGTADRNIRAVRCQIVVDQVAGQWQLVQNRADFAEFSGMFVIDKGVDNWPLVV